MYQEIETTHSSSQEKQEEVKRNWVELPPDVMSLIFLKLGTNDILCSAQWVCTSWWKLSKQPHLFRSIRVDNEVLNLFGRRFSPYSNLRLSMAREAIDRSCGQLLEFSIQALSITDGLLLYMSEKSNSLRCLRLVNYFVTDDELIETAKILSQLEELEIIYLDFSKDVIETFGRFCPQLKSCRLNYVTYYKTGTEFDGVALAIAKNMPELRHLNLFGNKLMDDDGLGAVLDGCPHLESLDLRRCFNLNFSGDLKVRCRNIKVIRLPNDPIDDIEYNFYNYESDDDYNLYVGSNYDYENYGSEDYDAYNDYDPYSRSI